MNPIAIELKGASFTFGTDVIFKNVSLSIPKGGSYSLIGPSGSGKSLLLKILAGLERCTEGSVTVHSQELGMLFQKNALFDSFSVLDNLLFPLKERRNLEGEPAIALAREWLARVGLEGTENLMPEELSGGMQKRLGIARALVIDPDVILYDEPTAGLDPITSRKIADLIKEFQARAQSTLIAVTNEIPRAFQLGDQIGLLKAGSLLNCGTPHETLNSTDDTIRNFISGTA